MCILCAVGVFFAVLIFQFSLTISLIIAILLLAVDIEVYGFVYVLGAELNGTVYRLFFLMFVLFHAFLDPYFAILLSAYPFLYQHCHWST
jgi:hypothetical protein